MEVLHEDNHLLVVYKPAGLLSQEDSSGDACLIDLARRWLIERHDKPGNAFVGSVHRLDRPVAGVMVLAKTSKAASRLAAQFREGTVEKQYRAVVHGRPDPPHGQLVHKLKRSWSPEHGTRVKVDARGKRTQSTRNALPPLAATCLLPGLPLCVGSLLSPNATPRLLCLLNHPRLAALVKSFCPACFLSCFERKRVAYACAASPLCGISHLPRRSWLSMVAPRSVSRKTRGSVR